MKKLGFTDRIAAIIKEQNISESELARVIAEHKERYTIQSDKGIFSAEIVGNMRFSAQSRTDFPAVGDWVRFTPMDHENAIILEILPRHSLLQRRAVSKNTETQVIASNLDKVFIVQAVGHDYNLSRIERYLVLCNSAKIEHVVVLTKTDLISTAETKSLVEKLKNRIQNVPVICLSNETQDGFDDVQKNMSPHLTYCFIGSSGVGKSTLINRLMKKNELKTNSISSTTNKGKHTTSQRELVILPNQSIVIDTPGMREVGITESIEGIDSTYDQIMELSNQCRYHDCTHTNEAECKVLEAVEDGTLSQDIFENYHKLKREQIHFSASIHEKRKKGKEFGKMVREVVKQRKRLKY